MKEISTEESNAFKKANKFATKPRTTIRKCLDVMVIGQKVLFSKKQDFPNTSYRNLYYMCKDLEKKEGKIFVITPNVLKDQILIEREK